MQEYSFQITMRQEWNDRRLSYEERLTGKMKGTKTAAPGRSTAAPAAVHQVEVSTTAVLYPFERRLWYRRYRFRGYSEISTASQGGSHLLLGEPHQLYSTWGPVDTVYPPVEPGHDYHIGTTTATGLQLLYPRP